MGTENVVITGGHLEGEALDLYYDGFSFFRLESVRGKGNITAQDAPFHRLSPHCLHPDTQRLSQ